MRKNLWEVVYQGKEKGSKCCIRNCGSGVCSRREGNKEKSRDLFEINAWKIFHKHPVKMFIGFWYLGSDNYTNRSTTTTTKSLQSCPTLCDPTDGSPPGSAFPGILQARTLEWVAISFSNAWKWKVKGKLLSCVQLLATPWAAAYQDPLPMGFSRQEYWSGVPLPKISLKKFKVVSCWERIQS